MNQSYLLVGIKSGNFLSMIVRNGGFSLRYILRVLFLLNAGIWSHFFARREKRFLKNKQLENKHSKPPVFVIGNWRTGTTFLHQLLSVDERFVTPSVFQVSLPDHFLVSRKYYYPVMTKAIGSKRPIDNVKIGFDEPQEDEYALLKVCKNTPLEDLLFPKSNEFFLSGYNNFIPGDIDSFKDFYTRFSNKVTFGSEKQLLFKNPFHSMRIALLKEMYPEAKFIHIYRDPFTVVPSTMRMWNIVATQNALKTGWTKPSVKAVAEVYKRILLYIRKEGALLPETQFVECKFEEFEKNPIQHIKQIYDRLGIDFTEKYEALLQQYLLGLNDYKKNSYTIEQTTKQTIEEVMKDVLPEYF